jgi:hypothetical protein
MRAMLPFQQPYSLSFAPFLLSDTDNPIGPAQLEMWHPSMNYGQWVAEA